MLCSVSKKKGVSVEKLFRRLKELFRKCGKRAQKGKSLPLPKVTRHKAGNKSKYIRL